MTSLPPVKGLYAILNLPYPGPLGPREYAEAMIAGGARWIQLRAKAWTTAQRCALAQALLPLCRRAGVGLAMNDDAQAAMEAGVDLLHVGQEDLAQDPALDQRVRQAGLGLGISTHSGAQFGRAQTQDWTYVAVGPIFGTQSKVNPEATVGVERLGRWAKAARIPVVAIGGVTPARARQLWPLGVDAVAVISAIQGRDAQEVQSRCRAFESDPRVD